MPADPEVATSELARVVVEMVALVVLAAGVVEAGVAAEVVPPGARSLSPLLVVVALAGYAYWRLYHTDLGDRLRAAVERLTGTEL